MAWLDDNKPNIQQFRCPRRARPTGLIVVHTAENAPDIHPPDSGAENVANFIKNRNDYGSYHDLCDSDSIINLVEYTCEAFHDGTGSNRFSYGVSAACKASQWNSLPKWWRDATVRNMARAAVRYARWVKAHYGITIPAKRITKAQSDAGLPGFISHADRDPRNRTDPGINYPWGQFFDSYKTLLNNQEDDDMTPEQAEQLKKVADNSGKILFQTRTATNEVREVLSILAGMEVDLEELDEDHEKLGQIRFQARAAVQEIRAMKDDIAAIRAAMET